jgi:hypothetical protein
LVVVVGGGWRRRRRRRVFVAMTDGDGSVGVSVPCGRRDFTQRDSSLRTSSVSSSVVVLRDDDRLSSAVKHFKEVSGLEPFVDEAERLATKAERMRYERERAPHKAQALRRRAAKDSIRDSDPKQGGEYFNRYPYRDLTRFNLDEECKSVIPVVSFLHPIHEGENAVLWWFL